MSFGEQRRGAAATRVLSIAVTPDASGSFTSDPANTDGIVSVAQNATVTATFTATSGWELVRWELDGVSQGSTNPITVTMAANHLLVAVGQLVAAARSFVGDSAGNVASLGSTSPTITVSAGAANTAITVTPTVTNAVGTGDFRNTPSLTITGQYAGS